VVLGKRLHLDDDGEAVSLRPRPLNGHGHRVFLLRFGSSTCPRQARASDRKDSWLPLSAMQ
jgi:hypothetical protein